MVKYIEGVKDKTSEISEDGLLLLSLLLFFKKRTVKERRLAEITLND